ncbi:MAG: ATP-binding protein [Rhodobacter sp.]|nr:ATP-binding protein [Rhodobacter sp.]MCY4168533.1 ATP-binding protein [Rhodobacter sp.]MCY4241709.1 ATP-binding protein [Rhodobacter sp.]
MADGNGLRFPRYLESGIREAMDDTRVVLISGPRQAGKTTLAKKLADERRPYVTLDDEGVYQAAISDPVSFIKQFEYVTIDEIQRVPALIREIKISVDGDQRAGRFLLTGSANILTIPTVSESLVGRMAVSELLPLSQIEIERCAANPLDNLFETSKTPFPPGPYDVSTIADRVLTGGYPEILTRQTDARRRAWANNYIRTLLTRDIREIMDAHHLKDITALLRASAIQSAQLIVYTHIANDLRLSVPTVQRYVRTLEQTYLIRFLPAWHRNELKRLIRTPKMHFLDSGLLAAIRKITPDRLIRDRNLFGPLLETFIHSELLKHASWSEHAYDFYHYRDKDKVEVDFVIERSPDSLIGVEVKASATIRADDFKSLKRLQSVAGTAFKKGIVFYAGERALPFGDRLQALPVSILWAPGR